MTWTKKKAGEAVTANKLDQMQCNNFGQIAFATTIGTTIQHECRGPEPGHRTLDQYPTCGVGVLWPPIGKGHLLRRP